MNVLLTGFEVWGAVKRNPSGEIARRLDGHVLPVDYDRAGRALEGLIRKIRPDVVLMLGLAEGRRKISLEAQAFNLDHCEDARWWRWRRPILRGGAAIRKTRLPIDRLHARLKKARIPVHISYHAGTFICNHVFYRALSKTRKPCGFVHVPPTHAVPLTTQVRAIRFILSSLGV